jgi:hypothetical protein
MSAGKRCPKCGVDKPRTSENFYANKNTKDGFACHCKVCMAASARSYYGKNRDARIAVAVAHVKKRRAENPEYDRRISREAKRKKLADPVEYAAHLERGRLWRQQNPEQAKLFKHAQKPYRAARAAKRYATKRNATPAWVDMDAINAFYIQAEKATIETGIEHEVDHIVPLLGRTVCGLHAPWNLRVIPAKENRAKSNQFDEALALSAT